MLDEKSNKSGLKYYTVTTSQIEDTLRKTGKYTLKEGDKINIIIINGENNERVIEHGGIVAITNTSKNQN